MRGTQGTLQKDMEVELPKMLPQVGPNWEITYGPVVWKSDPWDPLTRADNIWFVTRCPSLLFEDGKQYETYVVSVAATMSIFDWLVEDFEVRSVVDFVQWMKTGVLNAPVSTTSPVKGNSYIATGTAKGVHTILSYAAPDRVAGAGRSLYQYILTLAAPHPNSKIIFTGHSLAGALTPTLAAAVTYAGILNWPIQNRLVYPTAGATPGNIEFASLYRSLFPFIDGKDYQVWNANIANSIDVAPHGWCTNGGIDFNLLQLPALYGDSVPGVQEIINVIMPAVSKYNYLPIQYRAFRSGIPFTPPKTLEQWADVAHPEHVPAYLDYIGVQIPELTRMVTPAEDAFGVEKLFDASKAAKEALDGEVGIIADNIKADI